VDSAVVLQDPSKARAAASLYRKKKAGLSWAAAATKARSLSSTTRCVPQAEGAGAGVGAGGAVLPSAGALQPDPAAQQLDPAAQQVADGVQQVAAGVQQVDAALHVDDEQLDAEAQQLDCWQLLPQLLQLLPQLLPQLFPQLDRQQRDLPHFDAQQLRAKTSALAKTRPATVISALVTLRKL
jgi:X-X-X-Leu-X-X-Gly heptad repeat protein